MTNYVYIATSLDGYIADKNNGLDWLMEVPAPKGDDLGFAEFLSKVDALVMGRNTYEMVLSFGQWPYDVPVYVLSNTLQEIDPSLADKAKLTKGTPKEIIEQLAQEGHKDLYIDGGKTIQSFLKEKLIDEVIVTIIPKVLGGGISLYEEGLELKRFETYRTELLSIGAAKMYMKTK